MTKLPDNIKSRQRTDSPMSRRRRNAQRQVASLLRRWSDPHGSGYADEAVVRGVEIDDEGAVRLWVRPPRPHCPCCLFDLEALRDTLKNQKAVTSVTLRVVEIPDADRWTRALTSKA